MNETELKKLLEKYVAGELSETEKKVLGTALENPELRRVIETVMSQEFMSHEFDNEYHEEILARIESNIKSHIAVTTERRIFSMPAWAAAAAVVIVLFGSYYLISHKSLKGPDGRVAEWYVNPEIKPGGQKAVLTLANGRKIILDSVSNGMIARQGNTNVIKADSGKLLYAMNGSVDAANSLNTLTTPRGGVFQLTLPDGTMVWLNAASSITYPTAFSGKQRNVIVTGEVYFEVAHDAKRPFIASIPATVNTQKPTTIEVLGTHFNINSYSNESEVKTTLLQGSIKLETGEYNSILKPGDQAQIGKNGRVEILENEDLDQVMAWKTGYFNFKNADLSTVLRQLERWYDVDVNYETDVPQRRFQGELSRNLPLSAILKILTEMKIKYKIEGRVLTISK